MKITDFFKGTKPWGQLMGLAFLFLCCLMVALPLQTIVTDVGDSPTAIRTSLLVQGMEQLVYFLLPSFLFVVLFQGEPVRYFRMGVNGRQGVLCLIGVVIMVLLIPAIDWLSAWNNTWHLGALEGVMRRMTEESSLAVERFLSGTTVLDFMIQCLVVALVPAVSEEFFFRGALQPTLQSLTRNNHVGILLTALVFSAFHGDVYGFLPRFVMGGVLGYFYQQSGSMAVNVSAHFFNNLTIVVAYRLYHLGVSPIVPTEPLALPWVLTLCCGGGALMLYCLYFHKTEKKSV